MTTKGRRIFGMKRATSTDADINHWAKMCESLSEAELSESISEEDIMNTAFSTLLYFMCGEGNTVLRDDEWMLYLQNDINNAIEKGMFKPAFEDKQHLKKLQSIRMGETEDAEADEEQD